MQDLDLKDPKVLSIYGNQENLSEIKFLSAMLGFLSLQLNLMALKNRK
jgi:hypothetical protein